MKEQLPSPDFNARQYERPNQNWICGHTADGKPCRMGPDNNGRCRAAFECQPALDLKPDETKGRYRCTRPAEYGGPCEQGPLPNGTCSRPIVRCAPVRSLRARRKILSLGAVALTAGVLLVMFCGPLRAPFANPGELSVQHSTATFARLAGAAPDNTCAACHDAARRDVSGWLNAAFNAAPGPFQLRKLASIQTPVMNVIDHNCEHCHVAHSFHEPNVVREHSCSACHREHQGSGLMPKPNDANCLSCHASAAEMQASADAGRKLSADAFDFRPAQGRVLFKPPRPEAGYTKLIHSFARDHPEFQILVEKLKDTNTLKFNHALHLSSPNIQPLLGRKLECKDCHKPDAVGVLHLKITYEENCRACHSLQFDANNPELRLPHGSAQHVRDFLRSLSVQYADFGASAKGITGPRELDDFIQKQMQQIRAQFTSGEELEQRVFFSDARTGPVSKVAGLGATGAAQFPGCAYCHEVTNTEGAPNVTAPIIPDRWLVRGEFNHAKHFKIACVQCHDAPHSRDTADVLLPSKQTCVECHSPKGGVASNCSECHSYHSLRKEVIAFK